MHIAIFTDQPIRTLGGAQASIRLQKKYLEMRGHQVTVCAPAHADPALDEGYVALPSKRFGTHPEYRWLVVSKRYDAMVEMAFADLPAVDLVHVQGDMWGAHLGFAYARRHDIPTAITLHTNLGVGLRKVVGAFLARVLTLYLSVTLTRRTGKERATTRPWEYLGQLARAATVRIAPTEHFRQDVIAHGGPKDIVAIPTGCDDEVIAGVTRHAPAGVRFVWAGRMSPEKSLLDFVHALPATPETVQVDIYGEGQDRAAAERFVRQAGLQNRVTFKGRVSYPLMLQAIADASALVQTSVGFETQGMTVYEAVAIGTPVLLRDARIAEELQGRGVIRKSDDDSIAALARMMSDFARDVPSDSPDDQRAQLLQSNLSTRIERLYRQALERTA